MRIPGPSQSRLPAHRFGPRCLVGASLGALALVPAALAGQPSTQTLTPPPASFLVCKGVGSGTICDGSRTLQHGPIDIADEGGPAVVCGNGANAFHILDSAMVDQRVVRYYDQNGNLTRRVIHELWRSAQFGNSVSGAAVSYSQSDTITDVLATPGDFDTSTQTVTGNGTNVTVPGMGTIFLQAGRSVFDPDGTLDFEAGPDAGNDYFVGGDISGWKPVCAALGAS
jgi:hypothetical protein